MVEVWIYNGTNKTLDLVTSIYDVMTQRGALVPPGAQGHFTAVTQEDVDLSLAALNRYGAVPHDTVQSPATFQGVSHSIVAPVSIRPAPAPPIVEVRPPAKAPPPGQSKPKK